MPKPKNLNPKPNPKPERCSKLEGWGEYRITECKTLNPVKKAGPSISSLHGRIQGLGSRIQGFGSRTEDDLGFRV